MSELCLDDELVDALSPAAKYVLFALRVSDKPLTRTDIQDRTALATRTIDYALSSLRDAGLVEREERLGDARVRRYSAR